MKHRKKVLNDVWKELELGLEKSKHPFHIFTLTTINGDFPDSRYVVLRNVNEAKKTIFFNTDKRSNKIKHIKENNNACALFYDIVKKIQLRLYGTIEEEKNLDILKNIWSKSREMSKQCYLNKYAPGTAIENSKDYVNNNLDMDINDGFSNFAVLKIKIDRIDWLNLSHKGHERLMFDLKKNKSDWISP
tara:strand:- start:1421 stop:1987 length:567 start_codon:yes stop_codon:yes gene_type:complete